MKYIPLFAACFTKLQNMPWLVDVVSIASVIALMTTMMVCVSMNSRTIQAASLDSMLPGFMGKNNKNGVPAFAALITCICSMTIAFFPQITDKIVKFGAIFNVFTIVITLFSLFFARKKYNDEQIAFKAPGGSMLLISVLLILISCNINAIISGGKDLFLFTIIFLLLGLIIFYSRALWNKNDAQKGSN